MKTTTRELIERRAKIISDMRELAGDDAERNEHLDFMELENRRFRYEEDRNELNRLEVQAKLADSRAKVDGKPERHNNSKSRLCAKDVETIHKELHILKVSMEAGQEDYVRLRKANPNFLTFRAVAKSPQLTDRILSLSLHRGRMLRLAQELAGVLHKRALSTVQQDWKKHHHLK